MSTGRGHLPPLTLVACRPGWDDFQDLGETVAEMAQRLIDEDGQLEGVTPKGGTLPKEKDSAQIMGCHLTTTPCSCPNRTSLVARMELALERIPST